MLGTLVDPVYKDCDALMHDTSHPAPRFEMFCLSIAAATIALTAFVNALAPEWGQVRLYT